MKKLLIAGAGSYIGREVAAWLAQWPERYQVEAVAMADGSWRQRDFRGFDAVLLTAGIAHRERAKADPDMARTYDQVNHLLAVEVAQKARTAGVGQFLFMSSASVYGLTARVGQRLVITADTPLAPGDNYGLSKLQAERDLQKLSDEHFRLAIIRAPMVYGRGCRGNYQTLSKLARRLPVFPKVDNQRSMIYIANLAELIRLLLDDGAQGIFWPQDRAYVCTSDMVHRIAQAHGRKILLVPGLGWALKLAGRATSMADKAFGSLCYDLELSRYPTDYRLRDLEQAIAETEK